MDSTTDLLFHIGDRFELNPVPGDLQQELPPLEPTLGSLFVQREIIVTLNDSPAAVPLTYDPERNALQSPQLHRLERQPGLLVLECTSADPYRFRLIGEPPSIVQLPVAPPGAPVTYSADDASFYMPTSA